MTTNYVRSYMKCILLLVLTTLVVNIQSKDIAFTCDADGKIDAITAKNGLDPLKITIQKDDGSYCHYAVESCKKQTKKATLHVVVQSDLQTMLFGGQLQNNQYYNLKCRDDYEVSATAGSFMVSPTATPSPSLETMSFKPPPILSLALSRKDTTELGANSHVTIGEELTLTMSSSDYIVYPKECIAINEDHQNEEANIWKYGSTNGNTCSTFDSAITTENWKMSNSNKSTSIVIYGFQFTSSPNVKIRCSAHLCPLTETECSHSCLIPGSRRRRSLQTSKNEQPIIKTEEAHVSFRVVTENNVLNKANAFSVRFTVVITAILFGGRLTRFF